ncbi:MAG: hemerythrin family protein [Campylobacterales bacterium]|nr:hemerythrin family protein [Campylobacterales bacterium]
MLSEAILPRVALPSMNDTHLEELLLVNRLIAAIGEKNIEATDALLEELIEHTLTHFGGEEEMMRSAQFPPYPMHKGEHDRALAELRAQVASWHNRRDFASLEYYITVTLPRWIVQHIQTMDNVTANFLAHGLSPCGSGRC